MQELAEIARRAEAEMERERKGPGKAFAAASPGRPPPAPAAAPAPAACAAPAPAAALPGAASRAASHPSVVQAAPSQRAQAGNLISCISVSIG